MRRPGVKRKRQIGRETGGPPRWIETFRIVSKGSRDTKEPTSQFLDRANSNPERGGKSEIALKEPPGRTEIDSTTEGVRGGKKRGDATHNHRQDG